MSSPEINNIEAIESHTVQSALFGGASAPSTSTNNWRNSFPEIVGRSNAMLKVLETVSKIAGSDSSVLIQGDSGTGKELVAQAIHRLSSRSHKRFIPINCSAIPDTLLESELFGHEKGAFTGADRKRIGHFEMANGGTIFLDEIGDMPQALQAKLLRVLEDKKFTPLGSNVAKEADVRIIAATNKNLVEELKLQNFRLDLFYRLNVLPIEIPALNQRPDDIPYLLEHFVEQANISNRKDSPLFLSAELVSMLTKCSWPGNIRQLQNLVKRLAITMDGGRIGIEHLPEEFLSTAHSIQIAQQPTQQGAYTHPVTPTPQREIVQYPENFGALPTSGIKLTEFIEGLENSLIVQALERTQSNKAQAAKLLGMNRTTLVERIKKRKIQPLNSPSEEL